MLPPAPPHPVFFIEEAFHGILVGQIQFAVGPANKVRITAAQEIVPDCRAHETSVPRDIYFAVPVEHFQLFYVFYVLLYVLRASLRWFSAPLFYDAFFEVFHEVGADFFTGIVTGDLGHVGIHHYLHEFFK